MANTQPSARFREAFDSEITSERINEADGIILDVKVVGLVSRNGREYLAEGLRAAIPLYSGAKVYSDHKIGGRSIHERWGKLTNCRYVEGKGIYGDLEFLKNSPMTPHILEAVRRFGDCGLSHDAEGVVERRNGKNVVTKLDRVFSVDFVEDPATNSNLFESFQMKSKVLAVLREGVDNSKVALALASLAESKLVGDDREFEPTSDATKIVEAYASALSAVASSAPSVDEAAKRIFTLLGGSSDDVAAKLKESTEKVATLQQELASLKESTEKESQRSACVKLLESINRDATDVRVDALLALPAEKRSKLAESWPAKASRPDASPGKFKEEAGGAGQSKLPSGDEFFKAVMG